MRLWLVRHSNAVEADQFDGPDIARPLTGEGRTRARAFFRAMAKQYPRPALVLSSKAVRARQTADFFCDAFGLSPARLDAKLNPGESFRHVMNLVQRHRSRCDFLVLIGHEPMLTEAASQMTTDGRLIMKLRKCGLIELEISARGRPVLTGLFDPR